MTLKQYIGTRVRQIRKAKNLSQQQLSEKAEVGIDYISNLETKGSNIKVDTLEKIISALEIEVSDFFQV
ncbi:TPA: helix-turn-helix transcriptional regulator, partial [Streptococcus suis]|nr:helix-turn-helix transcriptional regulator [Streptococcus suis]